MSTLSLATSIYSDYTSYSSTDAAWCASIDFAAFIWGIIMVAAIPAATPLAGAATSYAADVFKFRLFTKNNKTI